MSIRIHIANDLRHRCGHDSRSVDGCLDCEAADALNYHEAQDGLLSKAQDEAARLRDELAETMRPLDTQMARLNASLIAANERIAALTARAECAEQRVPLTDEQIDAIWQEVSDTASHGVSVAELVRAFARAVGANHSPLMSDTAEFEVWQGDDMQASTSGPRADALREAQHYATQYVEDGPVTIYEVIRKKVKL